MSHVFTTRRPSRASLGSLAALDFGLQVRIEARTAQRTIFSSAEELPLQDLTSELAEMVSELRVRSFSLRGQPQPPIARLPRGRPGETVGFTPAIEVQHLDRERTLPYLVTRAA